MTEAREKLRRARVLMGWSQDKCDQVAGVKTGRTFSYERGRAIPTREYMTPLAEAWGIPIAWFYDGNDDMPSVGGQASQPTGTAPAGASIPVRGDLPTRSDRPAVTTGNIEPKVSFPVPSNAEYRRIADDSRSPLLKKGDLVLIVMDDMPRRDTISLAALPGGQIDVFHVVMDRDGDRIEPLTEQQPAPNGSGRGILGYVAQVVRRLAGGLTLSIECESGLSPEMLNL